MYKNSMLSGLLGFFIPALKLFAPRERIPRHLRTKKYPFSSTRQNKRTASSLYMMYVGRGLRKDGAQRTIIQSISKAHQRRNRPIKVVYNTVFEIPLTSRRKPNDSELKGAI